MTTSVRLKLALLVSLPIVLMAAAVPVLSSAQRAELLDAADDHVQQIEQAFEAEMEDDLADLQLTVHVLSNQDSTRQAIASADSKDALNLAALFSKLYPRLDIVLALRNGKVLGDVGPTDAPGNLAEIPELHELSSNHGVHAVAAHGCARTGSSAPPSHAILIPVESAGWVLACEPLDRGYLDNAADKLDAELAFFDETSGVLSATRHFPRAAFAGSAPATGTALVETGGRTWAVQRFRPRLLRDIPGAKLDVVAAVDVTKTSSSVQKHLRAMLGVLVFIAAFAVAVGARVAGVMSNGLAEVIRGYRRLAEQEYVRVPVPKTRDEIALLATGFNQMVDGLKERDKLRTTFGKYMTESVLEHLLSGKIALGGETLRVTVLFSDIRDFTTISEKMEAHALVALLNEYFTEMVGIVMRNGGVVDKYIGDAIMAIFGAPMPTEHDAENAVRAAVQMRAALVRLNEALASRGMQTLRTGIGIHTGDVVAGNIGSEQRMEYTVIGDPVNVASRLESATKDVGAAVLMSQATYDITKDVVEARPVRELTVKGRVEPVMTYEVIGLRTVPLPEDNP